MAELSNIDQGGRIATILAWFGRGKKLTVREIADDLINKFHSDNYRGFIHDERIVKNLMKNIRMDFVKIRNADIILKRKKQDMWETTNKFGEKYRKNQYKYWIDKDFTLPNNFSLGPNNLLVAMVLKENLKVFKNTDFQNKIDVLVDEIAVYVGKQGKTIKPGFFENLDTGISDYSILEDDLGEIIAAIISGCICTATYQNVGSREPVGIDFFPVKFLALKNTLYVLALNIDKREYRTYNLARFQPNSVTIHSHAKPNFKIPKLNWEEQRKKSFGIVYDKNVKKVKLEFLPGAVHYIKGRTWHFEPDISFRKNSNLIMKMEISITTELVSWIMRWMPNVIVHEPAELKEEVKKRLERSLKNNKW